MGNSMDIFDRRQVRRQRDRASRTLPAADFLFREGAERLTDRLLDVQRSFPVALDLGCHSGQIADAAAPLRKIDLLIQADLAPAMASAAGARHAVPTLVADEELLPVAPASLDLVLSNLSLQWVNDLPGALTQIRQALKPDGLLLAALLGTETLRELRSVLMEAEAETAGGVSPRVSPFVDVRDAGDLLTRAGFALPVVDVDTVTVTYADMFKLMTDLRLMGETNAVLERPRHMSRRALFLRAAALYAERFPAPGARIKASFQLVTLTAWAPHASQQRPLRPGTAKTSLAAALGTTERPAGESVPRRG
jgi:SAM-dependent methyltransferase